MKVPENPNFTGRMRFHSRHRGHFEASPRATILSLPEELKIQLLRGLHVTDLLSMRSTHPRFRDLIDAHASSVWPSISFEDVWPTLPTLPHFSRATEYGNMEALIKLGIAYLYNEGLAGDFQGMKITSNGEKAAEMFCKVETLMPHIMPFTWLFIRPPWATTGACCKECVFNNMKAYIAKKEDDISVSVCIAQTLLVLEEEASQAEAMDYLHCAATRGSPHAAFLLWHQKHKHKVSDVATELESIRALRDVVSKENLDSVLHLCRFYAQGKYGGITEQHAAAFVQDFIQSSKPTRVAEIYKNTELTHSMRYILVDWLVEVAGMKDFGSPTLHAAISVVDRYLRFHRTTRARFQLLGVAAMVLCSRFLGKDIITIREAAWLTDNTYKYEDVVRMMGEIIATLRGNIRVCCSLDYVQLMGLMAANDKTTQCLAEYICELGLLQSDFGIYPQAQVSASAILLARLAQKKEFPWRAHMLEFTGFDVASLSKCTMHLLDICFLEGDMVDHRAVILEAVKQRYARECFCQVSTMKMLSAEELTELLGMQEAVAPSGDLKYLRNASSVLIMSPSRNNSGQAGRRCMMTEEREKAATPTLEGSFDMSFNDSVLSGYDADQEDEADSFRQLEYDDESDFEQECNLPQSSCLSSSSGWFTSTSGFSSISSSPAPRGSLQPLRPTLGTSICINIPILGCLTSSPIAMNQSTNKAALPRHVSPIKGCHSVRYSRFSLGANSVCVTLHSDVDMSGCVGKVQSFSVDSGIELPSQVYEPSSDASTNTAVHNSAYSKTMSNESPALKVIGNSASTMRSEPEIDKRTRKRRNSVQLGNETKTHVISK